jgi:hypothetical protein
MGYDSSDQNPNPFYTNPRTGDTFISQAVSDAIEGVNPVQPVGTGVAVVTAPVYIPASDSSPGGWDTRARDVYGNLVTNQTDGNQYWMDTGYSKPDPVLSVKAAYSDAQVAYNNAVAIAKAATAKYGSLVSAKVGALATSAIPAGTPAFDYTNGAANIQQANTAFAASVQTASQQTAVASSASLSDITGAFDPYITWIKNNILLCVIAVAVVVLLPRLIPSGSRGRS